MQPRKPHQEELLVKISRLLPTCKVSCAEHMILSQSPWCFTCSSAYNHVCLQAATCQAQALSDLQAGCEVMKLGTPATWHDYAEKHACAYTHSLAMPCHHGLFPVFCPAGRTWLLSMDLLWMLGIHALGPRYHCSVASSEPS